MRFLHAELYALFSTEDRATMGRERWHFTIHHFMQCFLGLIFIICSSFGQLCAAWPAISVSLRRGVGVGSKIRRV